MNVSVPAFGPQSFSRNQRIVLVILSVLVAVLVIATLVLVINSIQLAATFEPSSTTTATLRDISRGLLRLEISTEGLVHQESPDLGAVTVQREVLESQRRNLVASAQNDPRLLELDQTLNKALAEYDALLAAVPPNATTADFEQLDAEAKRVLSNMERLVKNAADAQESALFNNIGRAAELQRNSLILIAASLLLVLIVLGALVLSLRRSVGAEFGRAYGLLENEVQERKRAELALRGQNAYLAALTETTLGLVGRLDVQELLHDILSHAGALMGTQNGYVFLLDRDSKEMVMRVGVGAYENFVGSKAKPGVALAGSVWKTGQPITVDDYRTWTGRLADPSRNVLRAVVGMPLKSRDTVVGILGLAHLEEGKKFGATELDVLNRFAALASVALDSAQLYQDVQSELSQRRTAETALVYERDLLQAIMDNVPDMIFFKDRDSRFVRSNAAHLRELGVQSMDEISGRSDYDMHVADAAMSFIRDEQRIMETGEPLLNQVEANPLQDGTERYFSTSKVLWRDHNGNVVGTVGIAHNITDTIVAGKKLEAEVAERKRAEQFLDSIVENLPTALFVKDARTLKFVRWNNAAEQVFGHSRQEMLGKGDHDFFPADEADFFVAKDREAIAGGQLIDIPEEPIETPSGARWLHTMKFTVADGKGEPEYLIGISEDITERKRAEQQIVLQTTALNSAANTIVITDPQGKIQWANAAFARASGYDLEEALGGNPRLLKSGQHPPEFYRNMWDTILAGKPWQGEIINKRKDGSLYYEEMTITPVQNSAGNIVNFVAIKQDVSERRRMQARESFENALRAAQYEVSPDGILVIGKDDRLLSYNKRFVQLWGVSDEVMATGSAEAMRRAVRDNVADVDDWLKRTAAINTQQEESSQDLVQFRDGRILERYSAPVKTPTGEYLARVWFFHDVTASRQAETRVRESEQRLIKFMSGLPVGVFVLDAQGKPYFANDTAQRLLGRGIDPEVGAEHLAERYHIVQAETGELIPPNKLPILRALHGEKVTRADMAIQHPEREIPIQVSATPILDEQGQVQYALAAFADITAIRRAEDELRRSEADLARAMLIAKLGSWDYDVASDTFTFTDPFYAMFHTTAEREGGYAMSSMQYAQRFVYPDDVGVVGAEIQKLLETTDRNYTAQLDHRIRYADGALGYISVRVGIIKDDRGRTIKARGVNQDITERKLVEEQLESERYLFQTLMDNLPHYIYFKDKESRFTRINQAQVRHLGAQDAAEVVGKSDFDYYDADFIQPVFEEEMRIIETGVPLIGKEECETFQDGRTLWETTTKMPLRALSGEIVGTFGVSMDITPQKLAEEQVREQNVYLSALQDISLGLIGRLDVNSLLEDIVARAGELVGTDNGYVFIREPGAKDMELRVGVGAYEGFVGRRTQLGVGLAGQVWASREPMVIDDYRAWGGRLADASRDILRAVTGVPLVSGPEVIGVIGLAYLEEDRKFGPQEMTVLERFAQLAAIALDNARLYESAQTEVAERTRAERLIAAQADRIRSLLDVSLELAKPNIAVNTLLDVVCQHAMHLMDADGAGVWIPTSQDEIELQVTYNVGAVSLAGRRLKRGDGLTGRVWANGQAEKIDDYLVWANHSQVFADAPFHAAYAIPMVWQGETVGVLTMTHSQPDKVFGAQDEGIAQLFATQAAAALVNSRLYRNVQQELEQRTLAEANALKRTIELESINRVASAMMSNNEIQQALAEMAQELVRTFHARNCGIALLNQECTELTVVADALAEEHEQHAVGIVIPVKGNVSSEYVIENKKSLVIRDAQNDPMTASIHERMRDRQTTCLAIIPLLAGAHTIGTIGLDTTEAGRIFTDDEIRVAETMAAQMAGAIEKQRLLEATQREVVQRARAEQISGALFRIADAVNTSETTIDFYTMLHALLGEFVYAPNLYVALYNTADDMLEFPYFKDEQDELADPVRRRSLAGKRITAWVIKNGKPLHGNAETLTPMLESGEVEVYGNSSADWLGIPLKRGPETFGMFALQSYQPEQLYSSGDIDTLMVLAPEIANAISRRNEQEALVRRNRELAVLNRVTQAVAAGTELPVTLGAVAHEMVAVFEARNCSISFYSPDRSDLTIVASATNSPDEPSTTGVRIPIANNPAAQFVLTNRQALVIEHAQTDPLTEPTHELMKQLRAQALMIVPLMSGGQVIGTVALDTTDDRHVFLPQDVRLAETIASQISGAIERQNLFDQTRDRARREQRSREIGASLTRSLDVDAILQTMARELSQALGASHAVVRMGPTEKKPNGENGH